MFPLLILNKLVSTRISTRVPVAEQITFDKYTFEVTVEMENTLINFHIL